jgi:quercetin dioxygenase-like cupin family protein
MNSKSCTWCCTPARPCRRTGAGEITVQCIEGTIEFTADGRVCTLQTGQLLYLPGGVVHSLVGVGDASALVTIVLRK